MLTSSWLRRFKQDGRHYYLDFHPDNRRLGIPSSDGVARIYDSETSELLVELKGHESEVNSLMFSPDGALVATVSDDHTVRLWDTDTGKPIWRGPALLASPPQLYSHRGWTQLGSGKTTPVVEPPRSKWRAAVETRARFAKQSPDGQLLCIHTADDKLEVWSLKSDEQLEAISMPGLHEVHAVSGACVVRTENTGSKDKRMSVLLVRPGADTQNLLPDVESKALSAQSDAIFVVADQAIHQFDLTGQHKLTFPAGVGVIAILRVDAKRVVVGYSNGSLEVVEPQQMSTETSSKPSRGRHAFEQTPSNPVVSMVAGPMGTLIAGYASGGIGLWDLNKGKRLAFSLIHGPVHHLLLQKQSLYAASTLGDHLVWDLLTLYTSHCELLRQVWEEVPIIWDEGRAKLHPVPPKHTCLDRAL